MTLHCYPTASGIEHHEHRTDQPWTVWARGKVVRFCNSVAEASRAFTTATHGGVEMLTPETWRCNGCAALGDIPALVAHNGPLVMRERRMAS
jgi:hypothetical protein